MFPYFKILLFLILTNLLIGCSSGRVPIPPGEIPDEARVSAADRQYGREVLNQISQKYSVVQSDQIVGPVIKVVDRLTLSHSSSEPWNIYVLDGDDVINAAATRGNNIFVWTGLLRFVQDDGQLAAVLGHEIGHVLAGHTMPTPGEQANQMIAGVGGQLASGAFATQGGIGSPIAGVAGQLVTQALKAFAVNPESQRVELEADQIGLFLMADAGYNPRNGVEFWKRMSRQETGSGQGPEFLSTHPSSTRRLEALEGLLPLAEEHYDQATGRRGSNRRDLDESEWSRR